MIFVLSYLSVFSLSSSESVFYTMKLIQISTAFSSLICLCMYLLIETQYLPAWYRVRKRFGVHDSDDNDILGHVTVSSIQKLEF